MNRNKKTFFNSFKIGFIFLLIFGLFIGISAIGIISGTFYGYIDAAEEVNIEDLNLDFTSFVYYLDSNNKPIELERLYGEENRIWVNINCIPDYLENAFIAIEDERFRQHSGIDIKRTLGATFNYVVKGDSSYGGSTITQQLIKNVTDEDEITPKRKIQEMWRAINLERHYSKEGILEFYLNTIYLGEGTNGVQAAANMYFGKDVNKLTLAEAASIAGITQNPAYYDPFMNPKNNKKKQEIILKKMLELNYISQQQYENAINEELNLKRVSDNLIQSSKQSYFVDQVIMDVLNDLQNEKGYSKAVASKLLYTGGLKIYSTIDPTVQSALNKVFRNPKAFPQFDGDIQPEAAMVVLDPYTGQVKGMVGGRGEKTAYRVLNRATQTLRQPGSSIKPIGVYAPALEYGIISPASVFDDVPYTVGDWSPNNWYSGYWGLSSVRRGIEQSMNIIAVKVLDKLGIDNSFEFLSENLKITSLVENEKRLDGNTYSDKQYNSLALGGLTDGVSVMEMTAAYVPFVNRGIYTKPYTYTKVLDHNGDVILDKQKESNIAMSEQTAFLMTKMMEGVIEEGTGSAAKLSNNIPEAGKTGTTSDYKDKWFLGYTPYYVGGVWFGFDEPKAMESKLAGHPNPATLIWKKAMDKIHEGLDKKEFKQPTGIVKTEVCIDDGKKPIELCYEDPRGPRVRIEYFKKGTEPTEECSVHVKEKINFKHNLLANEYCPTEEVEERVFIVRSKPYIPVEDKNGNIILPNDAQYELPSEEYCNEHGPLQQKYILQKKDYVENKVVLY